jgi:hypothetical protein
MRTTLVVLLIAACGRPPRGPVPPKQCKEHGAVLRALLQCADIRGGYSGFTLYEALTGPHRGARILASYGDSTGVGLAQWLVGYIDPTPRYPTSMWPNQCTGTNPGGRGAPADGTLMEAATYESEAAARKAFAYYCD